MWLEASKWSQAGRSDFAECTGLDMFLPLSRSSPIQTMHWYLISLGNIGLLLRLCIETRSCNIILQQKVAFVIAIYSPEAWGSWNCVHFPGRSVEGCNGLCRKHSKTEKRCQGERRQLGLRESSRIPLSWWVFLWLLFSGELSVAYTRSVLAWVKVKGRNDCCAGQKWLAFIEGSVAKIERIQLLVSMWN